jgi:hypothetical protein
LLAVQRDFDQIDAADRCRARAAAWATVGESPAIRRWRTELRAAAVYRARRDLTGVETDVCVLATAIEDGSWVA